jgi:phage N-6-adenine-methyltransferase
MSAIDVLLSTGKADWCTPGWLWEEIARLGIGLDAAAFETTARYSNYLGPDHEDPARRDALVCSWADYCDPGLGIFVNPPYSREVGQWIEKAAAESLHRPVVVLVYARTETVWWHEQVLPLARKITFIRGRLKFVDPATGEERNNATAPSVLLFFDRRNDRRTGEDLSFQPGLFSGGGVNTQRQPIITTLRIPKAMPNEHIRTAAMDIVCVFETGHAENPDAYSAVAVLADGAGISYGKHQATDKGGTLDRIVKAYLATRPTPGTEAVRVELGSYLDRLEANETAALDPNNLPAWAVILMGLLREAGKDPAMREVQDRVFEEDYWQPTVAVCRELGLQLPLSWALMYDTAIHSGGAGTKTADAVNLIRNRFPELPPSKGGGEEAWAGAYAKAREGWLAEHPNARVRVCVARPKTFLRLMVEGKWHLRGVFQVLGVKVHAKT